MIVYFSGVFSSGMLQNIFKKNYRKILIHEFNFIEIIQRTEHLPTQLFKLEQSDFEVHLT